jgi:hypothetical protein
MERNEMLAGIGIEADTPPRDVSGTIKQRLRGTAHLAPVDLERRKAESARVRYTTWLALHPDELAELT